MWHDLRSVEKRYNDYFNATWFQGYMAKGGTIISRVGKSIVLGQTYSSDNWSIPIRIQMRNLQ